MLDAINALRKTFAILCCAAPLALSACTGDVDTDDETEEPGAAAVDEELDEEAESDSEAEPEAAPANTPSDPTCTTPECRRLGGG